MRLDRIKKTALLSVCAALMLLSACKVVVLPYDRGDGKQTTAEHRFTTAVPVTTAVSGTTAAPVTTALPATTTERATEPPPAETTAEPNEASLWAERLIPAFEKRFFLNRLDEEELALFCVIYEAAAAFEESARFPEPITVDKLTEMMLLLNYECPELMQISGNYTYFTDAAGLCVSVSFDYIMDEFQYTVAVEEIGALFERWQQELSGLTDYEKEKFVYEYLIETCRYDEYAAHAGSCYGALIEGVARCEGYAKSFMWAMWALDIPCMTVTGEAANGEEFLYSRHSWNIVQIDGTYCYLDATYDDVEQNGEQFPISYGFFNVDQNSVEQSRETDALYLRLGIPDCASMDNSFYVKNRSYLRSGGQAAKMLSELLCRAVTNGEDRVYLKTETDGQFSELVNSIDTLLEAWLTENVDRAWRYQWHSYGDARALVVDLYF